MDCCEDYLLPLTNETMDNSTCSEGFMMNEDTLACEDIDEVKLVIRNRPCTFYVLISIWVWLY